MEIVFINFCNLIELDENSLWAGPVEVVDLLTFVPVVMVTSALKGSCFQII